MGALTTRLATDASQVQGVRPGVSKLVFLVAKIKPLVAKKNRASLARRAVINLSTPRAPYQLAIPLSNLVLRGVSNTKVFLSTITAVFRPLPYERKNNISLQAIRLFLLSIKSHVMSLIESLASSTGIKFGLNQFGSGSVCTCRVLHHVECLGVLGTQL